jgi:hypothetical protein
MQQAKRFSAAARMARAAATDRAPIPRASSACGTSDSSSRSLLDGSGLFVKLRSAVRIPKTLRSLARPSVDFALRAWGRWVAPHRLCERPIVIASSGRGGSTWLAEVINSMPGHPLLWEPLHLGTSPSCRDYGFDWQTYVPPGAHEPDKRAYLDGVFSGRGMNIELVSSTHFRPLEFARARALLVKFVCANLLLPWMVREFELRTLLLIRHPCAVVASQLRHSAWAHVTKDNCTFSPRLAADFPHFAECFAQIREPEEVLAFEWATQAYVPLASPRPHRWRLVAYETLLTEREAELERIARHLELPPDRLLSSAQLSRPSATTESDSLAARGEFRLDGWRRRLSARQIENIYRVVHAMGIHFYDGDAHPDPSALALLGTRSAA